MERRLDRGDLRLLLACAALTLIGLAVGARFFYDAFPEATIDFDLTRGEAREKAASFLADRGFDLDGYRQAALFRYDDDAKTFLERELGLEGASAVIGDPVRLWRWSNRWFRERQKEEFRVEHTTTGDLVGFRHRIEEEAAGDSLSQAEARDLARGFLSEAMGLDLDRLEFVEAGSTERPNRVDHFFTWKLSGFEVSDASYRYRVGVQGGEVGSFSEFLKVPEAWERDYDELRSHNEVTGLVAAAFLIATWVAMMVRLVSSTRHQDVRWRFALVLGGIAFVLTFLANINALPVAIYEFDTTGTFGSFLAGGVAQAAAVALGTALLIAFVVAGGEPEYRRWYGDHVRQPKQFLPEGIRTKRFLTGSVIGVTMTALFVAYQSVFYVVAERFGAWSPAQIPYQEMVNTYIPWVVVLLIGFLPAVSEEFTSRAFSIPFLHRFLRRRWAAVLISAAIWGFAHAGYPQQPFWIRGLEVGLAGVVVGYVFVRWGLLPVLVWHYMIDAFYTALILLRSSDPYFVLSAALSVGLLLLPLGAAVVLYLRRGSFVDPGPLLNREDSPPLESAAPAQPAEAEPGEETPPEPTAYRPLDRKRLGIAAAAVLAALAVFAVEKPELAPRVDYGLTRAEALEEGRRHLFALGVDVDSWRTVVTQSTPWHGSAVEYRDERAGPAVAAALYEDDLAPALWRLRLFRPGEKEEWEVRLRPEDGEVYDVRHQLAEEAPGDSLSEEEAKAVALDHLRAFGMDPSTFVLKEASAEDLPARRDHWFVWEAKEGDGRNLDEARFRCRVHVAGSQAASLERYVKLPEDWLRERREGSWWRTTLEWVPSAAAMAVAVHLLVLLVLRIRSGTLAWGLPLRLGLLAAAALALELANELPALYGNYPTEFPLWGFLTMVLVSSLVIVVSLGLVVAVAAGLCRSLYPAAEDRMSRPGLGLQLRDAVPLSILAVAGGLALDRLAGILAAALPAGAPAPSPEIPEVGTLVPALGGLLGAVGRGLVLPLAAGILAWYALRVIRRPPLVALVLLALGAAMAGAEAHRPAEFLYDLGWFVLTAGVLAAAVCWLFRDNVAAYALAAFLFTAVERGLGLVDQSAYAAQGWVLLGLSAALLAGLWLLSSRGDPPDEAGAGPDALAGDLPAQRP